MREVTEIEPEVGRGEAGGDAPRSSGRIELITLAPRADIEATPPIVESAAEIVHAADLPAADAAPAAGEMPSSDAHVEGAGALSAAPSGEVGEPSPGSPPEGAPSSPSPGSASDVAAASALALSGDVAISSAPASREAGAGAPPSESVTTAPAQATTAAAIEAPVTATASATAPEASARGSAGPDARLAPARKSGRIASAAPLVYERASFEAKPAARAHVEPRHAPAASPVETDAPPALERGENVALAPLAIGFAALGLEAMGGFLASRGDPRPGAVLYLSGAATTAVAILLLVGAAHAPRRGLTLALATLVVLAAASLSIALVSLGG